MTILEQYRQFRQSGSFDLLYQLADRLDALTSLERCSGEIPYSRHGMITRRVEAKLNDPEQTFATAIYRRFWETGIQKECYQLGISDETVTAYCQVRSRLYWAGKLTQEEWGLTIEVEETGIDCNPQFERSISEALDRSIDGFGIWEAA